MVEARVDLEKITNRPVEGFRAPLLQHSLHILRGLKAAGYSYDSSIPTWEPKHPRTMSPHGLGTIFPVHFGNIVEVPITTVQDHQMLSVMGLKPREVIDNWLSTLALIKGLNASCVFLSHPEYRILQSESISLYEELLGVVTSDEETLLATPNCIAKVAGNKG